MNKSTLFQQVCSAVFSGISPRCFPSFLAVWGGQTEREAPLADFKLHAARVRVCVGLAALAGVRCGISGQPVLEVGVVGADIDQRLFLVEADFRDFLALCQPCSHTSSFLPSVAQEWHFLAVFSGS